MTRTNGGTDIALFHDDGTIVPDSNAILVYLAKKLGRGDWLPEDPEGAARVQRISLELQRADAQQMAMARARAFIANNPAPRALFLVG